MNPGTEKPVYNLESYPNREQLRKMYKKRVDKQLTFQQFKSLTIAMINYRNNKKLSVN